MTKHTSGEVRGFTFNLDPTKTETMMLREYATLLAEKENNGTTHWEGTTHYAGCIQAGKAHYECALQEIGRLRGTIMDLRVKLEASRQEAEIHKLQAEKHYELGTEYFDLYTKAVRGQLKETGE